MNNKLIHSKMAEVCKANFNTTVLPWLLYHIKWITTRLFDTPHN